MRSHCKFLGQGLVHNKWKFSEEFHLTSIRQIKIISRIYTQNTLIAYTLFQKPAPLIYDGVQS